MSIEKELKEFEKKCDKWIYRNWNKGNLLSYWKKAKLSPREILKNKEYLLKKTYPIIITGSVGKTTFTRVLAALIKENGFSVYTTKVNDNWVPQLPFAVKKAISEAPDFAIFECAVGSRGDTELMEKIVPVKSIGYTEFSEVNLKELKSVEGVAEEKLGFSLKNREIPIIAHIKNRPHLERYGLTAKYYGDMNTGADFLYEINSINEENTEVTVFGEGVVKLKLSDIGLHLGPASCAAVALYSTVGKQLPKKEYVFNSYKNPYLRMQSMDYKGVKIVIDTANSNTLSILNSIETIINMKSELKKNAVIGEIYGLGDREEKVMDLLIDSILKLDMDHFDNIYFIGKNFPNNKVKIRRKIKTNAYFYLDEDECKGKFSFYRYQNQILLLRGPTRAGKNLSNMLENFEGRSQETAPKEMLV